MKKILLFSTLLLAIITAPALASAAESQSQVIVDGRAVGTATGDLLPLREIVEQTGGTVAWDGNLRQITIRRGGQTAAITIDNSNATVNGRPVELTVPPTLIQGRTMVSLCFLAGHLGLGAGYKNNRFILSSTPARQIPVITYHHILPDDVNTHFRDNPWTISTENFAAQMRYLRDNGFYTPTLDELEAFLYRGWPLPYNSVMIHFDDGYYSNYVYAYPILHRYGLRAVLFSITAEAHMLGEYQPPICHDSLTKAAAITLRSRTDIFETASHSHNMHHYAPDSQQTVLATETRENIIADTLQSFQYVSNHRAYAYPLGQFNDTIIEALQEAGITMAFTINTGYVTGASDPFRLNRFTIYRDTNMSRFRNIVNRRM